jgi:PAS domain S-box-containing protein
MPRETRTRRLTRPAEGALHPQGAGAAAASAPRALVSLLARTDRLPDLLPHLHQHAVEATGGACSLLFEHNPRNGVLQPTSGFGLDELRTDPWTPGADEAALVADAFGREAPTLVTDAARQMPELAARLGTPAALLLPLARDDERAGLVAIGFRTPPSALLAALPDVKIAEIADAFLTTLELFRLRRNDELQTDLRALLDEFAWALGASLNLADGLAILCQGAKRLFGADRAAVWIHDRRVRQLALKASSDPDHLARDARVAVDDPLAPAAAAMRRARAEILPAAPDVSTRTLTVPLRGCRRALGTIVFEGVRIETGGELALLDRADELGRQLSSAVENMQLLDEVLRSRRELENAFDSIAHLVVVYDRRGRITHANDAFAARLGLPRGDLVDRPVTECVGAGLAAWLAEHDRAGAASSGGTSATCEIVDPVLKGPFMVTVTSLLDQRRERVGTVIVARDLTPQSKLEAEREELRRRLTQSEKLAALGQFVAGIAHELNNPLQGVLGHLELMRATGAFPKQLRREMQTIYREADRAAKIVRNLLVFAGSRRLVRRSVSLPAVLQKVVALRQASCRSLDIEVVRHYDEHLPRVLSDPLLLHQVFLNIIMNAEHAVAATGRPGRVEIRATVGDSPDRVVVSVRDTGPGIAPDALTRIFEPFYTTKDVGKGTGLGLAIAYGIVQEHGGQISAANHPEGGAIFRVELPVAAAGRRE